MSSTIACRTSDLEHQFTQRNYFGLRAYRTTNLGHQYTQRNHFGLRAYRTSNLEHQYTQRNVHIWHARSHVLLHVA